jgi:hypothetical protein
MGREDLTGQVFGHLTVIRLAYHGDGARHWECLCDCGEAAIVTTAHLRNRRARCCGCRRRRNREGRVKDLSGQVFGRLRVIRLAYHGNKNRYWECACECGAVTVVSTARLRAGRKRSCGCLRRGRREGGQEDLSGRVFGRLTVLRIGGRCHRRRDGTAGRLYWVCRCACGSQKVVRATTGNLMSGRTTSCGCWRREAAREKASRQFWEHALPLLGENVVFERERLC